jgi:hypothetical protein
MTYSDPTERAAFIGGLRALTDYLRYNPEVPAPIYSTVHTFPPDGDRTGMRAENSPVYSSMNTAGQLLTGASVRISPRRAPSACLACQTLDEGGGSGLNDVGSQTGR